MGTADTCETRMNPATIARDTMQQHGHNHDHKRVETPVAAGVLYPAVGLLLSPIIAVMALTFISISVITNTQRLRRLRL